MAPVTLNSILEITKNVACFIIFLAGLLLFFASPRIVASTLHPVQGSLGTYRLLTRWSHLFFLEGISCLFLYASLSISGFLTLLPIHYAILLILALAFTLACLLSNYI